MAGRTSRCGRSRDIAAPRVGHQDVEVTVVRCHPLEEGAHLVVVRVVANHGYPSASGRRDLVGGVLHRVGKLRDGRCSSTAAPGDVDGCSLRAECDRDPTASASAGTSHQCHPTLKDCHDAQHAALVVLPVGWQRDRTRVPPIPADVVARSGHLPPGWWGICPPQRGQVLTTASS